MQLSFDYGLSKVVSLGLAFSHQRVSINATDFTYTDDNGYPRTETFNTSFRRTQVALRALFHYGNVDQLDMYSGIRIGILNRGFKNFEGPNAADLDETIFEDTVDVLSGNRFSGSITAFGLRYYFTENIGAGFELNLGAPYIANIGVSGRF
jgi:opacity protein-like surface antigen